MSRTKTMQPRRRSDYPEGTGSTYDSFLIVALVLGAFLVGFFLLADGSASSRFGSDTDTLGRSVVRPATP